MPADFYLGLVLVFFFPVMALYPVDTGQKANLMYIFTRADYAAMIASQNLCQKSATDFLQIMETLTGVPSHRLVTAVVEGKQTELLHEISENIRKDAQCNPLSLLGSL